MKSSACYEGPWGFLKISCESGAVTEIKVLPQPSSVNIPSPVSDLAAQQLQEYFEGRRTSFTFPIQSKGTPFQMAVWNALLQIPYGETRSYGQIAAAIGNPKASRAVGMACNKNPIWIVIPCHRVVGSDRSLTGYEGGLDMKQSLLALEHRYKL